MATVEIKAFTGIDQSGGAHNANMNIAYDAANCLTDRGILAPAPGFVQAYPSMPDKIVTLCSFYRRNHEVEEQRRVLVAATESKLYAILEGGSSWTLLMDDLLSGEWSYVAYESVRNNGTPDDTSDDYTTDILILSNPNDGMIVVYGDTLTAETKPDVPKFAIIERHAERIWGIGVEGEPDNIYYSRPFDPFNWSEVYDGSGNVLIEKSGGVIQMPTWDGDRFVALRRFANNLLAFKQKSAWYVRGVTAGEFALIEAYGSDGVFAPSTIVADGSAAFYLADKGLGAYDGDTASLLDNDRLYEIFRKIGANAPETACAMVLRHVLYLCIPVYTGETYSETVGGVTVTRLLEPERNNTLVVYDIRRKTYMVRTGIRADAIHNHGGRILFTSGDDPYSVYELTGYTYGAEPIPVKWESSWQDLGAKNSVKSEFVVYITGFEIQGEQEQEITLKIITEKKTKQKTILLNADMKKTRFPINTSGVRFKFAIEANSVTNWCISGGVQITMEVDEV